MIILGIESSCDETACAILKKDQDRITILSNVVASSASLQAKYGGIIPEQAAREQIKAIIPVIEEGLQVSKIRPSDIDAIAVTYGPGLIGSLLVGVETAKVLATIWNKPLIPVNHLLGHFYANWIARGDEKERAKTSHTLKLRMSDQRMTRPSMEMSSETRESEQYSPSFPCLGLLVSGGHTDLVLFKNHDEYEYLGGTLDDAAGECFDKCARLLGLPYPGGPQISKLAQTGDPTKFRLPVPMQGSKNLDFSYSGLKTAVANIVSEELRRTQLASDSAGRTIRKSDLSGTLSLAESFRIDLAAAIEETIVQSLIEKVILAIQKYKVDQIMVAGGVAANQKLANKLQTTADNLGLKLHLPPAHLCTDNGAMIASRAFFEKSRISPDDLQADPNLSLNHQLG